MVKSLNTQETKIIIMYLSLLHSVQPDKKLPIQQKINKVVGVKYRVVRCCKLPLQ